jgi:hypothetical protein
VCVCLCVCERERMCVCGCEHLREREREKERERETGYCLLAVCMVKDGIYRLYHCIPLMRLHSWYGYLEIEHQNSQESLDLRRTRCSARVYSVSVYPYLRTGPGVARQCLSCAKLKCHARASMTIHGSSNTSDWHTQQTRFEEIREEHVGVQTTRASIVIE